ncbi:MAG TPA: diguanylate cyclase [Trichormus sp.]|jgi:diguanylate cyclase (GGDEF)-like protein
MTNDGNLLPRYMMMQKALLSSLRLKDVLDAAVLQFSDLSGGGKVAIFLSDNESLALKLMAAKGYSEATLDQLRVVPFSADTLLKYVVQKRQAVSATNGKQAPDISASVMTREGSAGQIALPLISANLLVGTIMIDVANASWLQYIEFLKDAADITALAIANSILFGRSEYERERLSTLYKTSCALSSSVLKAQEVLQIAADTALILGNTPSCAVLVYDANQNVFRLAAFKGLDGSTLKEFDMSVRDTIAGACLRSGRTEYIGDGSREPYGMPRAAGSMPFSSVLALPMIRDGQPIGVIEVFSTETRAFHREQIELLESLTSQVTTALNVAFTHESTASQSINDAHTGLYNRLHFEEALGKEIERSGRHKHELSLLLVDIDHLSHLNEHLGQERGDEAIKHIARIIKAALRDIDVPCRFGGNEFAIILPETAPGNGLEVGERLRQKLKTEPCPGVGTMTVSIGLASFPKNADETSNLVKSAEQALDIAKYEGRDRVKEAQSGAQSATGPIAWDELSRQAKLSVLSERQARANTESRLTVAPEYAAWLTKTPSLVRKKGDGPSE